MLIEENNREREKETKKKMIVCVFYIQNEIPLWRFRCVLRWHLHIIIIRWFRCCWIIIKTFETFLNVF